MIAPTRPLPPSGREVALGVLLGLGLHLLCHGAFAGAWLLFGPKDDYAPLLAFLPVFFIGATQIVYMLPAILVMRAKKRRGLLNGLLICAGITFLLNAGCYGFLFMTEALA